MVKASLEINTLGGIAQPGQEVMRGPSDEITRGLGETAVPPPRDPRGRALEHLISEYIRKLANTGSNGSPRSVN